MMTVATSNVLIMLLAFIGAVAPLCWAQSGLSTGGFSAVIDCVDMSKPLPVLVVSVGFTYINMSVDWKDSQNAQIDTLYINFRKGVVDSNLFLWQSRIEGNNDTIVTNPIPADVTSYMTFESYNLTGGGGTLYSYHTYSQPGTYAPTYNVVLPTEKSGDATVLGVSWNQCWNKRSINGSDCLPDSFSIGSNGRCRVISSAVPTWSARFLVLLASVSAIGCMV
jgi:hypothetical protein